MSRPHFPTHFSTFEKNPVSKSCLDYWETICSPLGCPFSTDCCKISRHPSTFVLSSDSTSVGHTVQCGINSTHWRNNDINPARCKTEIDCFSIMGSCDGSGIYNICSKDSELTSSRGCIFQKGIYST